MAVSSPKVNDPLSESGPGLLAFLSRRAVASLVSLVVFVTGLFFLIDLLIPYDNAAINAGGSVSVGFVDYMAGLARGDLGQSYSGAPVAGLISEALPTTLFILLQGGFSPICSEAGSAASSSGAEAVFKAVWRLR